MKSFKLLVMLGFFVIACIVPAMADVYAVTQTELALNTEYMQFDYNGEAQYYKFTIPNSGEVSVTMQASYDGWIGIYNYDETKEYDTTYFNGATQTSPETRTLDFLLEKGTYVIKILQYRWASTTTGPYKLKIAYTDSKANESEPNNTFEEAMNLGRDTLVTGFVTDDNPIDFYKLSIPSSERVDFNIIAYSGKSVVIYNSDYDTVGSFYAEGSKEAPNAVHEKYDLSAGTYYVKISDDGHWRAAPGKYQFRWYQAPIEVEKIEISGKETVKAGKSITLKAIVTPSNASNPVVTWKSSDNTIATVNANGKVTGKNVGYVVITATSTDGTEKYATYGINVAPKKVTGFKVSAKKGKKLQLKWSKVKNVTNYEIQYSKKKNFKSSKKIMFYSSGKSALVTIGKKGTYYVRMRATYYNDKYYYGDWSQAKKVKINK